MLKHTEVIDKMLTNPEFAREIYDQWSELSNRSEWRPIETAPRCTASTKEDNGKRPVLVCRWPITGFHYPVAVARLTRMGWISGKKGNKLWFVPTHWQKIPKPPEDIT